MSVSGRWAIQRIFDITLVHPTTSQIFCRLTDLKKSSFSQEATIVYSTGGAGNSELVGFDHSKKVKMTIDSAMFLADLFSVQNGYDPVVGANTDYVKVEEVTILSDVGTLSATPLGTAGSELAYAYLVNSDGSLGTEYEQDSAVSAGKFTVSGTTITFNTSEIADNAKVFVKYNTATGNNTVTYSSFTNIFSRNVKMIADSVVRDCNGTDYPAQILIYNGKASNNFTFDLDAGGDPSIQNLEIEALKTCTSNKLWDLILLDA